MQKVAEGGKGELSQKNKDVHFFSSSKLIGRVGERERSLSERLLKKV